MINLIKNNKHVVGISVRGKKFNLNRELCSLLEQEEKEVFEKLKKTKSDLDNLSKSLSNIEINSNGELITCSLSVSKSNEIKLNKLEFISSIKDLDTESKESLELILNDFLKSINKAIKQKNEIAASLTRKIAA